MASSRAPVWVLPLAIFPLLFGGVALAAFDVWTGIQTRHWPAVSAVILSSSLKPSPAVVPQPSVRYRYEWKGGPRISARIWPGALPDGLLVWKKETARSVVNQFKEGEKVKAFINPENGNAILIPGPGRALMWFGIFLFFCVINAWAAWMLKRTREEGD